MIETTLWRCRIGTFLPRCWKTSRSVSTGTIILPHQLATAVLLFSLLVVCGDIESNPGPVNGPFDESEHVKIPDTSDRVPSRDILANQPTINIEASETPTKTKETAASPAAANLTTATPALDLTTAPVSYIPDSAAESPVSATGKSRRRQKAKKRKNPAGKKALQAQTNDEDTVAATANIATVPLELQKMSAGGKQARKRKHNSDLKIVTPQTHVTVERSDECTSYEVAMDDNIYQSGNVHDKGKHCTKNKDLTDPKYEVAMGEDIYPYEADNLQTHGAHCTKNPGHKEFIPVTKFDIYHLPPELQHKDVFEFIKKQADLTVKIITKFVSKNRPDEFPGSQYRGSKCTLTGTGYCCSVRRCGNTAWSDQFCQCQAFKNSGQPQRSWWEVEVVTAAHVVFDNLETANTEVVFFYDDTKSQTIKIQGPIVRGVNVEKDRCFLECMVHVGEMDEVMNKLEGLCQDVDRVSRELRKKYGWERWDKHCVIISHPHGSTKQVSVGKRLKNERVSDGRKVFCYDVPTCPGSSGAVAVWSYFFLVWWGLPHSKGGQDGIGRTGIWELIM